MATNKTLSEAEVLEQYRIALENVQTQPEIAATMAEFGYDETVIAEGKEIYNKTLAAYDHNKTEDDETSEAYNNFSNLKAQLDDIYTLHRKKAKVVFRNDENTYNKLGLKGNLPRAYVKWLQTVKKFYSEAIGNTEIETKLARLKVTPTELQNTVSLIAELETARAEYVKEKGESQDATKIKDAAFTTLDEWMYEFYNVAKIALDDSPQLLESIGKFVRS